MKLSIIVPVYNMAAEDKLKHCLDSLIAQTVTDYEIIGVDDCSTDDSYEILKSYEEKYPDRFRAIHSEVNKHQGGAKNIGIRAAKGDWIGFIDADDWITPDMYEQLIDKAEETGATCVGCDYSLVNDYTFEVGQVVANSCAEQTGVLEPEQKKAIILNCGSLVVKIYKRSIILENDLFFPEDIFYEDNAMGNSYLLTNERYEYIPKPLYYYYQHAESTVHTVDVKRCQDRMVAGRIMIDEAKRLGFYEDYRAELEFRFAELFYVNTLFTYMPCVKPTRLSFVRALSKEMAEYFPDFQSNPYYQERIHAEEKKLIAMAQRSTLYFFVYYKLLWAYRNFRKRLSHG